MVQWTVQGLVSRWWSSRWQGTVFNESKKMGPCPVALMLTHYPFCDFYLRTSPPLYVPRISIHQNDHQLSSCNKMGRLRSCLEAAVLFCKSPRNEALITVLYCTSRNSKPSRRSPTTTVGMDRYGFLISQGQDNDRMRRPREYSLEKIKNKK